MVNTWSWKSRAKLAIWKRGGRGTSLVQGHQQRLSLRQMVIPLLMHPTELLKLLGEQHFSINGDFLSVEN